MAAQPIPGVQQILDANEAALGPAIPRENLVPGNEYLISLIEIIEGRVNDHRKTLARFKQNDENTSVFTAIRRYTEPRNTWRVINARDNDSSQVWSFYEKGRGETSRVKRGLTDALGQEVPAFQDMVAEETRRVKRKIGGLKIRKKKTNKRKQQRSRKYY